MTTFQIGDAVWYTTRFGTGPVLKAVITGIGEKDRQLVYDVEIVGTRNALERDRWGYADQLKARSGR